jgi:hypothetical protein
MFEEDGDWYIDHWEVCPFYNASTENSADLSNECVARRQADAIEQYLYTNKYGTWGISIGQLETSGEYETQHKWRLDRIKWCLEKLVKDDE